MEYSKLHLYAVLADACLGVGEMMESSEPSCMGNGAYLRLGQRGKKTTEEGYSCLAEGLEFLSSLNFFSCIPARRTEIRLD
ncbi:unnamed protein product [Phytomonas sp. Hart1]|nr:unnamed protein product [Phytomonas sp. Hart1]|eukprot:CCW67548.1 unnamed protein product [Phytomonas sp. isolate Hart1]